MCSRSGSVLGMDPAKDGNRKCWNSNGASAEFRREFKFREIASGIAFLPSSHFSSIGSGLQPGNKGAHVLSIPLYGGIGRGKKSHKVSLCLSYCHM